MTTTVSEFHQARGFGYDPRESRLKKCAALIRTLRPGRLLDTGCAQGDWAQYWQQQGWEAFGTDINESALAGARAKNIQAVKCDLNREPLPFEPDYFDLIFAGEVLEHLVDTDAFLKEIRRCLKPDGHLLLTTPNLASWENRVRLLLGKYPRWLDYRLEGCGHVRGYTPAVLKQQLRETGLTVVRHTGNWVPFLPQSWIDDVKCPALGFTGALWPNLSMDIIILARKSR